jgi:hypothetical protein
MAPRQAGRIPRKNDSRLVPGDDRIHGFCLIYDNAAGTGHSL